MQKTLQNFTKNLKNIYQHKKNLPFSIIEREIFQERY